MAEEPNQDRTTPSPEHTAPDSFARYPTQEHSWILQQLHEQSTLIGGLKEAVDTLKTAVADQNKKLNRITLLLAGAGGAVLVIGWLVDKRFDSIISLLNKS